MPVTVMHGTHNTFAVLDERPPHGLRYEELARRICSGKQGLGVDGLLVVSEAPGVAGEMRIFNADGGEAEMCGNGVRCVGRYLAERGAGDAFTVRTVAGPVGIEVIERAPEFLVRLGCGIAEVAPASEMIEADERTWLYWAVSVGNPHIVIFVEDVAAIDLERLGPPLSAHERFPHGTNVHIAHLVDPQTLKARHYERGVGLTQSCGTGAIACAAAAIAQGRGRSPMVVEVPGGRLMVNVDDDGRAWLCGPAETVGERAFEFA